MTPYKLIVPTPSSAIVYTKSSKPESVIARNVSNNQNDVIVITLR